METNRRLLTLSQFTLSFREQRPGSWSLTGEFLEKRAEFRLSGDDQRERSHQLPLQLVQLLVLAVLVGGLRLVGQRVQVDQQQDQLVRPAFVLAGPRPGGGAVLDPAGLHERQQLPQHRWEIRVSESL